VGALTGVWLHDHNCGFKCYRRGVLAEVRLYGELHRFVPVLAASRGWKVGEIVVQHRPRQFGQSKYGLERFVKGLLDLFTVYFLTSFGRRPQHLLGTLGLFAFLAGGVGVLVLTGMWVFSRLDDDLANDVHLHERAVFYYSMGAVLLGAQFLSVGLLAELFTAFAREDESAYSVESRVGVGRAADGNGQPEGGAARQPVGGEEP
jgi:dolichol-phosphate mannosyltransferase